MMMDHNDNHHPHPRDPADWLTDGATLGLIAALIQMIAGAGFDSIQVKMMVMMTMTMMMMMARMRKL